MILFFPYRTDAPVYHFPYATIGLIVVNVLAFFAMLASHAEGVEKYILVYGDGLHPLQWVTSNFVHGGFMHLIGNMVFLWTFGLLVEGKLGSVVFVLLYLGMGFVQCGAEQIVMMRAGDGGSFGASAIIFGLMAISFVWAPRNDVGLAGIFLLYPLEFDAPILIFAGLTFVWEVVQAWLVGFTVSTAVLHMSGAVIGFAVGVAFLKLGWVDCEGWDMFAVMSGTAGEEPRRKRKKKKKKKPATITEPAKRKWPPDSGFGE